MKNAVMHVLTTIMLSLASFGVGWVGGKNNEQSKNTITITAGPEYIPACIYSQIPEGQTCEPVGLPSRCNKAHMDAYSNWLCDSYLPNPSTTAAKPPAPKIEVR